MSADFVLTETDQVVAVSFAGRKDNGESACMLELFNLDNALSLRAALEMGMEVTCPVAQDSSACNADGTLTLARLDELTAEGRVTVGRFCATVELGDLLRLQLDSAPEGLG